MTFGGQQRREQPHRLHPQQRGAHPHFMHPQGPQAGAQQGEGEQHGAGGAQQGAGCGAQHGAGGGAQQGEGQAQLEEQQFLLILIVVQHELQLFWQHPQPEHLGDGAS